MDWREEKREKERQMKKMNNWRGLRVIRRGERNIFLLFFFHHHGGRGANEVMERRLRKIKRRTIERVFRRIIFGS